MIGMAVKKVLLVIIFVAVVLNLFLFLKRQIFSGNCDLDSLLKDKGLVLSSDLSDGLDNGIDCVSNVPCEYPDVVDFRIIVLTFDRWNSLTKLLNSVNDLRVDGDSVALEIWIDRRPDGKGVDEKTLAIAKSFRWKNGAVRVHVQTEHVGILGQWIDTWRPARNRSDEIVLILEDDLSLSPYSYRWLKAAKNFFKSRADVTGVTLQSESLIVASSGAAFRPLSSDGVAYLYSLMGSWGFSPTPEHWLDFQNWYHSAIKDSDFHPYVEGLVMNSWFKKFQKERRAHTMWTMWFIYYCNAHHLYTVYNNLNAHYNTTKNCLAVNRREPGLHFSGKAVDNTGSLLRLWKDEFVDFTEPVQLYGFNGRRLTFQRSSVAPKDSKYSDNKTVP